MLDRVYIDHVQVRESRALVTFWDSGKRRFQSANRMVPMRGILHRAGGPCDKMRPWSQHPPDTPSPSPCPAFNGQLRQPGGPRSAVVIGGGLAGLAAAVVLAERGVQVTVLEREHFLGGRAGAWTDRLRDGTTFDMERGFHAFFRQYYNLRQLLKRVDPALGFLKPTDDYPILTPTGNESFAGLTHAPLVNVAKLTWRTETLGIRDLMKVNVPAALAMLRFDFRQTYADFDQRHRRRLPGLAQLPAAGPPAAAARLRPLLLQSAGGHVGGRAAADAALLLHGQLRRAGVRRGRPAVLPRHLRAARARCSGRLGASVRMGVSARALERRDGEPWVVETDGEALAADLVVLATEVPGVKAIVGASRGLDDAAWRRRIDSLRVTNAFAVWRLWLDRPVARGRSGFAGTAGVGPLDNISVYENLEDESRAWADAHRRVGGGAARLRAARRLRRGDAEAAAARGPPHPVPGDSRRHPLLKSASCCGRIAPLLRRAATRCARRSGTPFRGLCLAGDFVQLPFPSALMERAASAGILAANTVLGDLGVAPEPLWSVAVRGPLAKRS